MSVSNYDMRVGRWRCAGVAYWRTAIRGFLFPCDLPTSQKLKDCYLGPNSAPLVGLGLGKSSFIGHNGRIAYNFFLLAMLSS